MENMIILQEKENPLFNRKEIILNINSQITPSTKETEELLAKKFSTKQENIKIKKILGKFGSRTFEISANIYDSKEDKEQTEIKTKKQREAEKAKEERIKAEAKEKSEKITQETKSNEAIE